MGSLGSFQHNRHELQTMDMLFHTTKLHHTLLRRYISNHPIFTSPTMDPLHSPHPHQTLPNTHFRHQPLHITPFNKTFHTPRAKLHTLTTPTICTLNTPPHIQLSAMSQSLQLLVLGLAALSALPRVPTCLV